jgi:hypothetical protein
MNTTNSDLEVYGFDENNITSYIDIIVENGYIYKQYYTSKKFDNIDEVIKFQQDLILDHGYLFDNMKNNKWIKLYNPKNKITYKFWSDNFVEKIYQYYIGPVIPDQTFF